MPLPVISRRGHSSTCTHLGVHQCMIIYYIL